jgi:hypothetical protein
VSHLKERKEKICLNCHTALFGRYCHVCGQENLEPKETVWHLIQHFFNDITHFDGKFFSTVKYLLKKPGLLSAEYMAGRRASYLNPIRMYVFTSAIFFLIIFSLKQPKDLVNMKETPNKEGKKGVAELEKMKQDKEKKMKTEDDADDRKELSDDAQRLGVELAMIKRTYGDTTTLVDSNGKGDSSRGYRYPGKSPQGVDSAKDLIRAGLSDTGSQTTFFGMVVGQYKSVDAYDSLEKRMPDSLQDGWFTRAMKHRFIATNLEYHRDKRRYFEHVAENMLHSFPKILFFSLPFFALILNMLYFRRKQYYYVDHGIFAIHVYCATFILILATVLVNKMSSMIDHTWFTILAGTLIFVLILYMMIYLYKAMRGFYGQGRGKTFLKYFITCLLAFIVNSILLVLAALISAIEV